VDRIFLPPDVIAEGTATVKGSVRRHITDSLRLRAGERFLATDGLGVEYLFQVEAVDRTELVAKVIETRERKPGPGCALTLAISPPRGGRMEIAVEKAVECGVGRIVPLTTSRSVLKDRRDSSRPERWRRIARSATAQSGRVHLPEITETLTFDEALDRASEGKCLLAHPGLQAYSIPAALSGTRIGDPVTLFVGPEGGFTDDEVDAARRIGALEVSLGPTRLRSETAAIAAVTLVVTSLSTELSREAG
jgi:16S rRNA (uracil1498-N3)-methyltransferase